MDITQLSKDNKINKVKEIQECYVLNSFTWMFTNWRRNDNDSLKHILLKLTQLIITIL